MNCRSQMSARYCDASCDRPPEVLALTGFSKGDGTIDAIMLPSDMLFIERGWLSSNQLLLTGQDDAVVIDSGYVSHAAQTLALVRHALNGQALRGLWNTHLHSDHCGGNAALQAAYPDMKTWIPPGLSQAVQSWDDASLTFQATGQSCPRFTFQGLLLPGTCVQAGGREWHIHAAPGHDPDAVLLFEPQSGVLLSADALWENGFGVIFPEILGEPGFDDVASTLDLIERLHPHVIVPGHGRVFDDVTGALRRARDRLDAFRHAPLKHASHAAKVLMKFRLLEIQRCQESELMQWAERSRYLQVLHDIHYPGVAFTDWAQQMLDGLVKSGALIRHDRELLNA